MKNQRLSEELLGPVCISTAQHENPLFWYLPAGDTFCSNCLNKGYAVFQAEFIAISCVLNGIIFYLLVDLQDFEYNRHIIAFTILAVRGKCAQPRLFSWKNCQQSESVRIVRLLPLLVCWKGLETIEIFFRWWAHRSRHYNKNCHLPKNPPLFPLVILPLHLTKPFSSMIG